MAERKAARVLPEPVGAAISVCRPSRIAGQPSRCGGVGLAEPGLEPPPHRRVKAGERAHPLILTFQIPLLTHF